MIWALMTRVWRVPRVRQTAHPARSRLSSVQPAPSVREPSLQPFPFVHHVRLRNHTGTSPLSPSLCCHRSPFSSTGPAQGYSGLLPCHPDFPPTLLGLLPPRRHLRPRILLLHVCICLSTLSYATSIVTPAPSPQSAKREDPGARACRGIDSKPFGRVRRRSLVLLRRCIRVAIPLVLPLRSRPRSDSECAEGMLVSLVVDSPTKFTPDALGRGRR